MRMRTALLLAFLYLLLGTLYNSAQASGEAKHRTLSPVVRFSVKTDRTLPLRNMKPMPVRKRRNDEDEEREREIENRVLPKALASIHTTGRSSAPVRSTPAKNRMPATFQNFDGTPNLCNCLPPDTNGDVGPNHYVQMVNDHIQVFDKAGNSLLGPEPISTLWQGFGGACETQDDGDPIVLYDQLADRWLVSQFALFAAGGHNHECIAISQTGDPTGAYNRYDFDLGILVNDYPHIGVWPDGYYMTVNQFNPDFTYAGAGVYSFERDKMIAGQQSRFVYFNLFFVDPGFGGMLPSDLDGPAPAPGTPNMFAEIDDDAFGAPSDRIDLWEFHVDWSNPAGSTFGLSGQPNLSIDTAPFDANMCNFDRSCIPQPGTAQGLDAITDRLMHRLQYRAFAGYSTLVGNHTVDADGNDHAGIDWFELRNNGSGWGMQQEGIYAPDGDNRWMGSAAMDAAGNIALGFSVSGHSTFPSIRYTGRLASDPPGQMTQGESTIIAGSGSQEAFVGRWGDYSALAVDPSPGSSGGIDCDFWYTNEYLQTTGGAPWRTRVGAFSFAPGACGGPHGELQGTVTDGSNSAPLAGATVEVQPGGFSTTTDGSGHYHFQLSAGSNYQVKAFAYGYFATTHSSVAVTDGGTTVEDFTLDAAPHATVSGVVSDASGHGWPLYARIDIAGYPFNPIFTNPITGAYNVDLIQDTPFQFHVQPVSAGYSVEYRTITPPAGGATENFALSVDVAACAAPGYAATGGFTEAFDSGDKPAGWTVIDNAGNSEAWAFVDPEGQPNNTGGDGLYAVINSDFYGPDQQQDTELRSPAYDFSALSTVHLAFDTDFNYFGDPTSEIGDVDVSTDSGTTWTNVRRFQNTSTPGPHHEDIDISGLAGNQGSVVARFHYYNATFAFWWQVDNFRIGVQCDPVPGGLLAGNVYDANTGLGLNQAAVTSDAAPSDTVKTAATPLDPNLDDGFYLLFSSIAGSTNFTASLIGYQLTNTVVNIQPDQVTAQNFNLAAGSIVPSPLTLEDTVALGNTDTLALTLNNSGGAPADYTLFEGAGTTASLLASRDSGAPLRRVDGRFSPLRPGTGPRTKHGAAGSSTTERDTPASPWTGVANYPLAVLDNVCAEVNGLIYCTGGVDPFFAMQKAGYVYDPATDSWSPIADMSVERDRPAIAVLNGKIYVAGGWGFSGDPLSTAEVYDPAADSWAPVASMPVPYAAATGVALNGKFYVIGGCDTLLCGFKNVQVYDPAADAWTAVADYPEAVSWSSCGAIDGMIYCAGGAVGEKELLHTYVYDPALNTWTRLADMPLGLWGSYFVVSDDRLVLSGGITNHSNTITNEGFAYDPSTDAWTPIANARTTAYRGGSACGLYRVGGNIDILLPTPVVDLLPGFNHCDGTTDIPWLSENPGTGSIAGNSSQQVDVTFDAAQVSQPGDYLAHLRIKENTPYSTPDVQVVLHVPLPAGWGFLSGTVSGLSRCDAAGGTLESASVHVDTAGTDSTVLTDNTGHYQVAYLAGDGPATLTVTRAGYVTQSRSNVEITAGQTHTEDFTLRLDAPCLSAQPEGIEATVDLNDSATLPVTLHNTGAAAADFELLEGRGLAAPALANSSGAPVQRIRGQYSPLPFAPSANTAVSDAERTPTKASPWMDIADYPVPVVDDTCAEIDGLIYCVGGVSGLDFLNSGYVYNPGSNSWSPIAPMSEAREKPAVAVIEGKLYVTAGWSNNGIPPTLLEIYDPLTNTWDTGAPIPIAYGGSTGVNLNGKFYVIGGCTNAYCSFPNVQVYDPATDSWSAAADYPEPVAWNHCGAINGLLYCAGGADDIAGGNAHTYVYDPGSDSWSPLADMPQTQWGGGFVASDQYLYVSGGVTQDRSVVTNEGFVYDTVADHWEPIANSNNAMFRGGSACGLYKMGGSFAARIPASASEVFPGLTDCGEKFDLPWLSESPTSGTLDADTGSQNIDVTLDTTVLNQPGDYPGHIRIRTSYQAPSVPVLLHVPVPAEWGTVEGTVTGLARCDAPGSPLRKATVVFDTAGTDYTVQTDASGHYRVSFLAADGPATITVTAPGYVTQELSGVSITPQQVLAQDFQLRLIAPCASKSPAFFDVNLASGESVTLPLTLNNTGARDMSFQVFETLIPLQPQRPNLPRATEDIAVEHTTNPGPYSVESLRQTPGTRQPLMPSAAWFTGVPVPGGLARFAHAQCDTQPNSVYIISGVDGVDFTYPRNNWRYDAVTNSWTALAPVPRGTQGPVATCYQGRIYVLGGSLDGLSGSNAFYIYDIASDSWFEGASLPRPVWGAAVAAWNGKVYLAGGDPDFRGGQTSGAVNIYDIATNSWTGTGAMMPVPSAATGFAQAGPFLYVVGGWQSGMAPFSNVSATQRYDMEADAWTTGPDMPAPVADFALAMTDRALYAIGGDADGGSFFDQSNTVERLDWTSWPDGSWEDTGNSLPASYSANGGFCTQAIAAGSEIWSLGGVSAFFSIDGYNFFHPLATEHCFSIYSDVPWLSVDPNDGGVGADSSDSLAVHFDASGLPSGDYHAVIVVSTNDSGATQFQIPVTLHVGLFHDDFNDGDFTTPAWIVTGPRGAWDASTGDLVGTTSRKIDARSPDFGSGGCTNCTITANLSLHQAGERVSVFGWRAGKDDFVEVRLSADSGKLMLLQKSGGVRVTKHTEPVSLPAGDYTLNVSFDGAAFHVQLSGAASAAFSVPAGATPHGTLMFRVKSTGGVAGGTLKDVTVF